MFPLTTFKIHLPIYDSRLKNIKKFDIFYLSFKLIQDLFGKYIKLVFDIVNFSIIIYYRAVLFFKNWITTDFFLSIIIDLTLKKVLVPQSY